MDTQLTTATFQRHDGIATITGEIDMANAHRLREVLALSDEDILVDLAGVTFLDSSGITVLVNEAQRLKATGHKFCVINPQPLVERVLAISGALAFLTSVAATRGDD